ncbi:MAG: hypothetical protein L0271_12235 [Gemmatimonadetes bacterium]|nr:hypothetical protein [Gemmatimonadota bacterium]
MKPDSSSAHPRTAAAVLTPFVTGLVAIGMIYAVACATSSSPPSTAAGGGRPDLSMSPPSPDPRIGLKPGRADAGAAAWNLRLVSNTPSPEGFYGVTNSDLAFIGKYVFQGNYNGFQVWDITNPARPGLARAYLCPASQSDVSVYRHLLFVSAEAVSARLDCGTGGVQDTVSHERIRGIRIFDATDPANPRYIANVQTCRGSHTHTVVWDPDDRDNVYVYISGSSRVRPPGELTGCEDLAPDANPTSEDFRIEVIQIPLARPDQGRVVSGPRIFEGLGPVPGNAARDSASQAGRGGRGGAQVAAAQPAGRGGGRGRSGPSQCHDITVYPEIGLAGGACGGYGLLLDISDVANPRRIDAVADSNFAFWHSATFSNDGSKILFTDEWGGGSQPRCRDTDRYEWGANALFTLENRKMVFKSYYKMPAPQTTLENCVAHNGSLIPIPGRDVMVQGWYQGGISVFDWTDTSNPKEIAFYDRGPVDSTRLVTGGSWSVYWYNGLIVSSEIARGLDIFELVPSGFVTQNEIDAARTVQFEYLNAQEQRKMVWPASFALARAYLDQLERSGGLAGARIASTRDALSGAERASGQQRRDALTQLATQLNADVQGSRDAARVRMLVGAVRDLTGAQR